MRALQIILSGSSILKGPWFLVTCHWCLAIGGMVAMATRYLENIPFIMCGLFVMGVFINKIRLTLQNRRAEKKDANKMVILFGIVRFELHSPRVFINLTK